MSYFTLQLLHLSDGEAGLLAPKTAPNLAALVDAFDDKYRNTLILSGGDNFIPSPFLNAGSDPFLNTLLGATALARPDIAIHNALGVQVSGIGNHEWDLGSSVFADAIRASGGWIGAQFALVSANIDVSNDSAIRSLADASIGGSSSNVFTNKEASELKGKIVPSTVLTFNGEKVGVVGATTQLIESISSPSGTEVKGFPVGAGPNGERDDMDLLASQLQPVVDQLISQGINKIILIAHLQQISNEQDLAPKLKGVDIILAAGSNTRLGDSTDVAAAFSGHSANFSGTYPLTTAGSDGKTTLIVNTDNEYTYLGRLVVDFDLNGEIISESVTANKSINGAYASTDSNVAAAWGIPEAQLSSTAFAVGTKGANVTKITSAVQSIINNKDGDVFGYTNVYLEGERSYVRSQETNFGNMTADANSFVLREILGSRADEEFIVSLKNGGGIRAQIGAVSSSGGSSDKLAPLANPEAGKLTGGISLLDIENSLRFDNKLMVFDTDAVGLKTLLENGVTAWPNQGRFPQVGGIAFSWDPDAPSGSRVSDIALINDSGDVTLRLYDDGILQAGAPSKIKIVTLNFIANGGDSYPSKLVGENFRYLLDNGSLSALVDKAQDFTSATVISKYTSVVNLMGEQQALREYLESFHNSQISAYNVGDTPESSDLRIQNLNARADSVLKGPELDIADRFVFSAYDLAFNRKPDEKGFYFWANNLEVGSETMKSVLENFLTSPEMKSKFGASVTNEQFVFNCYANALDRAPDQGGLQYWSKLLDSGQATRSDVAFAFTSSDEHISIVGQELISPTWIG
jgi:2',3'-cyclic-nucleotide 2'-phosphodiesterase (5'-nucleotidase family)